MWRDHRAELTRQLSWLTPDEGIDIVDYMQQARRAHQRTGQPPWADPAHQHESADIVSGAGLPALAVAAGRAVESSRPDRLINDPFAEAFVHAAPSPVPLSVRWLQQGTPVSGQEAL